MAVVFLSALGALPARAAPSVEIVALVPAADARRAVAVGNNGEVFEGDGTGAFIRTLLVTTADRISAAGRSGDAIVALGEGVVYRLEPNGWSALRIANKLHATLSSGPRAVAAAGRVVASLDRATPAGATTLATADSAVLALGAGQTVVLATDRGVFRIDGKRVVAVKGAPRRVTSFAGDRWALVPGGAVDLRTGRTTPWPADVTITAAAQAPSDHLLAAGTVATGGVVVIELGGPKLLRTPVPAVAAGTPVALAADAAGRLVVALRDGQVALRDHEAWTVTTVRTAPPAPHPGSPPATSP